MRKGMKYHVLFLANWKVWSIVVIENRTMNTTAAAIDGL